MTHRYTAMLLTSEKAEMTDRPKIRLRFAVDVNVPKDEVLVEDELSMPDKATASLATTETTMAPPPDRNNNPTVYQAVTVSSDTNDQPTTRSGRVIKLPKKYRSD